MDERSALIELKPRSCRQKCIDACYKFKGAPAVVLGAVTLALFTDTFAYGMIVPYNPLYQEQFNISEGKLGVLLASYAFSMVPLTPLAGT